MVETSIGTAQRRRTAGLVRMTLATAILVVVQVAIGMVVNLYVSVPRQHPGARPANYFAGSLHSVAWAVGSGPAALAVHASAGLAVVAMALALAVRAVAARAGWVAVMSVLAATLVIGAGFNGASFLDFAHNVSSLIMALLALGALTCYLVSGYVLGARRADQ
ncbi:MAG: hypothetical protein ACYDH5_11435 [Acidimicrobiales bacterium]